MYETFHRIIFICPSYKSFLKCFRQKTICIVTVWKWMHYLGYKFDEQKKCYFTDRHEHTAQKLENDQDIKLLENIYDQF